MDSSGITIWNTCSSFGLNYLLLCHDVCTQRYFKIIFAQVQFVCMCSERFNPGVNFFITKCIMSKNIAISLFSPSAELHIVTDHLYFSTSSSRWLYGLYLVITNFTKFETLCVVPDISSCSLLQQQQHKIHQQSVRTFPDDGATQATAALSILLQRSTDYGTLRETNKRAITGAQFSHQMTWSSLA